MIEICIRKLREIDLDAPEILIYAKLFIKEIGSMPPEKKHGLFLLLVKLVVFGSFLTWLVVLEILDGQTCETIVEVIGDVFIPQEVNLLNLDRGYR